MSDYDIHEPVRLELNQEEKVQQQTRFFRLVHILLILYVSFHNLIIPLILNIYKNNNLLIDVHFWFLIHFFTLYIFVKKDQWSGFFGVMALSGAIFRLIYETYMNIHVGISWGLFSIYLSEVSATVLYAFYFSMMFKNSISLIGIILSIIIAACAQIGLHHIEVRGEIFNSSMTKIRVKMVKDLDHWGCQGSVVIVDQKPQLSSLIKIIDCGFEYNYFKTGSKIEIVNLTQTSAHLRLFSLNKNRPTDRFLFKKLILLAPNEKMKIALSDYGTELDFFVIKSIEKPQVGMVLLLQENQKMPDDWKWVNTTKVEVENE